MKNIILCLLIILHAIDAFCPSHRTTTFSSSTSLFGLRGKRIRREKRKAMQEPTPPRLNTPYGPIRLPQPPKTCETCIGRGIVRCTVCQGKGVIKATGHRKRNDISNLVKSQWTSVEVRFGHRHHTVVETRGSPKDAKNYQARMRNCCGETHDFWIPVAELRQKGIWRKGWLTLQDIVDADGGALRDARLCFRCKGGRILQCIDCDGKGQLPNFEPLYQI